MDALRFEVQHFEDEDLAEDWDAVPYINGRSLIELAEQQERPSATSDNQENLAGSYRGLTARQVFAPSRHFLGEAETYGGGVPLLRCGCGEVGCWPLVADVVVGDDSVVWRNFRQPHRKHWSYDGFGPFEFDRAAYETALLADI